MDLYFTKKMNFHDQTKEGLERKPVHHIFPNDPPYNNLRRIERGLKNEKTLTYSITLKRIHVG